MSENDRGERVRGEREVDCFSIADPAVARCPHAYYTAMRREAPVHKDPGTGYYWISTYDAVTKAAKNVESLSSSSPIILRKRYRPKAQAVWEAAGMQALDTLVTSDPPEHDHYRAVGKALFPPQKAEELEPHVEACVDELLTELGDRREFDFFSEFACRLPARIVCDEFGFPREDQPRFKRWVDTIFELMVPGITEDEEVALVHRLIELFKYLEKYINKAAEGESGRVLHTIATMSRLDGKPFTMLERAWLTLTTFVGGNDTTIGMLTSGVRRMACDTELQATLRNDLDLLPRFIEELLRTEGSVKALLRVARHDMEIEGVFIPKGANVVLCTESANRDEARWEDPDTFKLDRSDARRHLSFGHGIHACIGMHLARRELRVAFHRMLEHWSNIELAVPESEVEMLPLPFHRGYAGLPIRVSSAVS